MPAHFTFYRNFEVELLHDAKGIGYWFIGKVTLTKCILCNGVSFTWWDYTAIVPKHRWNCRNIF